MSLGEFQLISKYFAPQKQGAANVPSNSFLKLGIGDDAAVLQGFGNQSLNISVDTLVEGVHFPINANPELLAKRALRVNLSDMAAMGATPKWFTLALTLPNVSEKWLESFSTGLHEDAAKFGCTLIGGDTTKGPLNIGLQIMGLVSEGKAPLKRSGAKAGDYLVVSGTLGDAGAALDLDLNTPVQNAEESSDKNSLDKNSRDQYFLTRYWLPSPRVELANQAADFINAACDISDGLLADAGHLCERSGLSVIVEQDKIPVSDALNQAYENAKQRAATAGDDYELCMAVSPENIEKLNLVADRLGITVTIIGQFFTDKDRLFRAKLVDSRGGEVENKNDGYTHF